MATYYLDPAAAGADNGTSWANAWTTLARAIAGTGGTPPAAGDTVYCRGAESSAALVSFNSQSGTVTGGRIRYIGCNAAGVVDGTRYAITFPSSSGISAATGIHRHSIENFDVISTYASTLNYQGFRLGSGANYNWRLVNVVCRDWINAQGFSFESGSQRQMIVNCRAINCEAGYSHQNETHCYIGCEASGNSTQGFSFSGQRGQYLNCIAHSNAIGFRCSGARAILQNCVAYGNLNAGIISNAAQGQNIVVGCRIVRNGVGIEQVRTDIPYIVLGTYFGENAAGPSIGPVEFLAYRGNRYQNILYGTDVNHGFVSPGAPDHDYRLRDDASLRDVPFLIP